MLSNIYWGSWEISSSASCGQICIFAQLDTFSNSTSISGGGDWASDTLQGAEMLLVRFVRAGLNVFEQVENRLWSSLFVVNWLRSDPNCWKNCILGSTSCRSQLCCAFRRRGSALLFSNHGNSSRTDLESWGGVEPGRNLIWWHIPRLIWPASDVNVLWLLIYFAAFWFVSPTRELIQIETAKKYNKISFLLPNEARCESPMHHFRQLEHDILCRERGVIGGWGLAVTKEKAARCNNWLHWWLRHQPLTRCLLEVALFHLHSASLFCT